MSFESRLKKVADKIEGGPNIKEWRCVVKIDGQYYTTGLTSKERRLLTNKELTELRKPGVGLIVLKLVDAPIPEENNDVKL